MKKKIAAEENFEQIENRIFAGNNIDTLKTLPDCSIDCSITSPPYYRLRDYGTAVWIGGNSKCSHQEQPVRNKKNINKNTKAMDFYKGICSKCGAIRKDEQIGLEPTPDEYIKRLVEVFREVKRVLKDDGTLWIVIADSYAGSGKSGAANPECVKNYLQTTNKG